MPSSTRASNRFADLCRQIIEHLSSATTKKNSLMNDIRWDMPFSRKQIDVASLSIVSFTLTLMRRRTDFYQLLAIARNHTIICLSIDEMKVVDDCLEFESFHREWIWKTHTDTVSLSLSLVSVGWQNKRYSIVFAYSYFCSFTLAETDKDTTITTIIIILLLVLLVLYSPFSSAHVRLPRAMIDSRADQRRGEQCWQLRLYIQTHTSHCVLKAASSINPFTSLYRRSPTKSEEQNITFRRSIH